MKRQTPALAAFALVALVSIAVAEVPEPVRIYSESADATTVLYADNALACPVSLRITFTKLDNYVAQDPEGVRVLVPPSAKRHKAVELAVVDTAKRSSYAYRYAWTLGDPATARHAPEAPYLPPYAHGEKFRMVQAFDGTYSHFGAERYAVDFDMPVGTPVHAARDGLVVRIKEDSDRGGPSRDYTADGNFVEILHNDGSFGVYHHFKKDGVAVTPGQKVRRGELIAYSGNTGFSDMPHLHFVVMLATERDGWQSTPFALAGRRGEPLEPVEGRWYLAAHEGKPAPGIKLGEELTPADYAGYRGSAAPAVEPHLRSESVDDTVVLFLENGTDADLTVEVTLTLTNMETVAPNPVRVSAPAGASVFVALLRPIAPSEAYKWRAGYTW